LVPVSRERRTLLSIGFCVAWSGAAGAQALGPEILVDSPTPGPVGGLPRVARSGDAFAVAWADSDRQGAIFTDVGADAAPVDPYGLRVPASTAYQLCVSPGNVGGRSVVATGIHFHDAAAIHARYPGSPVLTPIWSGEEGCPVLACTGLRCMLGMTSAKSGTTVRRIAADGTNLDDAPVVLPYSPDALAVAAGTDGFAVTYYDYKASFVRLRRFAADGAVLDCGKPIDVASVPFGCDSLAIAALGEGWLVTWIKTGFAAGVRIGAVGAVLDAPPISFGPATTFETASRGGGVVVAYQSSTGDVSHVALLDANGALGEATPLPTTFNHPSVAATDTTALATTRDGPVGPRATRWTGSGPVLDDPGVPLGVSASAQREPRVAYGAGLFLVVFRDERSGLRAARIDLLGNVLDDPAIALPGSAAAGSTGIWSGIRGIHAVAFDGDFVVAQDRIGLWRVGVDGVVKTGPAVPPAVAVDVDVIAPIDGDYWGDVVPTDGGTYHVVIHGYDAGDANWSDLYPSLSVRSFAADGTFGADLTTELDKYVPFQVGGKPSLSIENVAAGSNGKRALWFHQVNGDHRGYAIDATGIVAVPPTPAYPVRAVAGGAPGFLVLTDQKKAYRYASDGSPAGGPITLDARRAAWTGSAWALVDGASYVRFLSPDGALVGPKLPSAATDVASDGNGHALFVESRYHDGAPHAAYRVHARLLFDGGAPLGSVCVGGASCASGQCVSGVCCDSACEGHACRACSVAMGAPKDGICSVVVDRRICRPKAAACDAAERCDGVGEDCPADEVLPDGFPCPGVGCSGDGQCENGMCTPGKGQCEPGPECQGTGGAGGGGGTGGLGGGGSGPHGGEGGTGAGVAGVGGAGTGGGGGSALVSVGGRAPVDAAVEVEGGGCGCRASIARPFNRWFALALLVFVTRRRRAARVNRERVQPAPPDPLAPPAPAAPPAPLAGTHVLPEPVHVD
jgi:hypothetical protein